MPGRRSPYTPISSERTAFIKAASTDCSSAITSPVAFICVPSTRSPPTNLSKGQRGIFTAMWFSTGSAAAPISSRV